MTNLPATLLLVKLEITAVMMRKHAFNLLMMRPLSILAMTVALALSLVIRIKQPITMLGTFPAVDTVHATASTSLSGVTVAMVTTPVHTCIMTILFLVAQLEIVNATVTESALRSRLRQAKM